MSKVRNPPVRAKRVGRRKGGRTGVALRVAEDIASRFRDIRAVWFAVNNDPNWSNDAVGGEFFQVIGLIIEGVPLQKIQFTRISRERVLAYEE